MCTNAQALELVNAAKFWQGKAKQFLRITFVWAVWEFLSKCVTRIKNKQNQ